LFDANRANNYMLNRATFNPTDELVLNDGVLWDVRSGKSIHKFDKFNPNISGVFHPMGLEIIINSEVVSFCDTINICFISPFIFINKG
jgi:HIV-1 Vpr-binding protein